MVRSHSLLVIMTLMIYDVVVVKSVDIIAPKLWLSMTLGVSPLRRDNVDFALVEDGRIGPRHQNKRKWLVHVT